jgi:predicted GIY-YIG superfamily endonuclease
MALIDAVLLILWATVWSVIGTHAFLKREPENIGSASLIPTVEPLCLCPSSAEDPGDESPTVLTEPPISEVEQLEQNYQATPFKGISQLKAENPELIECKYQDMKLSPVNESGIYFITVEGSDIIRYVGKTTDLNRRLNEHKTPMEICEREGISPFSIVFYYLIIPERQLSSFEKQFYEEIFPQYNRQTPKG